MAHLSPPRNWVPLVRTLGRGSLKQHDRSAKPIYSNSTSTADVWDGSPKSQSSTKLGAPRPDSGTWVFEAVRVLLKAVHSDSTSTVPTTPVA